MSEQIPANERAVEVYDGVIEEIVEQPPQSATRRHHRAMLWPSLLFGVTAFLLMGMLLPHFFSTPVDDAEVADVSLKLASARTTVTALPAGSRYLVSADVDYAGVFYLNATGDEHRTVDLGQRFGILNWHVFSLSEMMWDVGLSPDVPMNLSVDGANGDATLRLDELNLLSLDMEGGTGKADLYLPAMDDLYAAIIDVASGSFTVDVPDDAAIEMAVDGGTGRFDLTVGKDANLDLDLDISAGSVTIGLGRRSDLALNVKGGTGKLTVNVPRETGVRIEVQVGGAGPIKLPDDFVLVDNMGDNDAKTSIWESPDFGAASYQVTIIVVESSAGGIIVEQ